MNQRRTARARSERSFLLVPKLALADLRHEWILTCCVILGVTAVVAPLLILFGLKYGTIATLRHRLIEDPQNREVTPLDTRPFGSEWFDQLRQQPFVSFVVPQT